MTPKDSEAQFNENKKKKWNPYKKWCELRKESPEFRRCCFCVPLRRGLVGWGYLKVALNMWAITFLVYYTLFYMEVYATVMVQIVLWLTDAAFNVLFIFAGHQKKVKVLKIAFVYSFVWLTLMLLVLSWLVSQDMSRVIVYIRENEHYSLILAIFLPGVCVIFAVFVVQIYWILLIRSLLVKLQDHTLEFQFYNRAADAQCTLHKHNLSVTDITDTDGQDEKLATSVENTSSKYVKL